MWKYKTQTLISVLGLAIGFTCFALATLWIRYEMTYDSFLKNAKQLYVIYKPDLINNSGYTRDIDNLASQLKETFPEITNAISLNPSYKYAKITIDGVEIPASTLTVDSTFLTIFDVKVLEGSRDFLIRGSNKCAITQSKARQLFGDKHPIGEIINNNEEICAIVSDMSKHSNYPFDFIKPGGNWGHLIIELLPGTNIKAFEKKLYALKIRDWGDHFFDRMIMRPVTKIRYTDPEIIREVNFQHIVIFSISGLLIILCSLFNYLTVFVSRFRIRQKELALRVVNGASAGSLMTMLSVEFVLTLLAAVFLGCCLTLGLYRPFVTLSEIHMDLPSIYRESLLYISGVMLVSLLVFRLILFIFRRRTLNLSIRRSNNNLSRKISVIVQLVISIGFAFCTLFIMKQMYFLHHGGVLGFSFQNRGSVMLWEPVLSGKGELVNLIKQIPEITDVVDADGMGGDLFVPGMRSINSIQSWDDKPVDVEGIHVEIMYVTPEFLSFHNLQLVEGEMLTEDDAENLILINESAVKAFGWRSPIGKKLEIGFGGNPYSVKGVVRNMYCFGLTVEAKPEIFLKANDDRYGNLPRDAFIRVALFKFGDGMWKTCREKIDQMINKEYTSALGVIISNSEERFEELLKSENALIKLLSFLSAICVLISVFGFVSLVSLTCEERRKSIAIRKINGATSGDILTMFFKEYSLLLIIGAVIAFTTGYFIMQRWLEHYVKQTDIPAWLFLFVFIVMAFVIVLCVGWQVYKTSIVNPAEVVKTE